MLQLITCIFLMSAVGAYNLGFQLILYELNDQFEKLLVGINTAFTYRKENKFQNLFIDCIRHHQLIIK